MSDATGRQEMERKLIERSLQDEDFRRRLLQDPKATVEQELDVRLPEEVRIVAVEETAYKAYIALPSRSPAEQGNLSDQELEAVAGGGVPPTGGTCAGQNTCNTCGQWGCG